NLSYNAAYTPYFPYQINAINPTFSSNVDNFKNDNENFKQNFIFINSLYRDPSLYPNIADFTVTLDEHVKEFSYNFGYIPTPTLENVVSLEIKNGQIPNFYLNTRKYEIHDDISIFIRIIIDSHYSESIKCITTSKMGYTSLL